MESSKVKYECQQMFWCCRIKVAIVNFSLWTCPGMGRFSLNEYARAIIKLLVQVQGWKLSENFWNKFKPSEDVRRSVLSSAAIVKPQRVNHMSQHQSTAQSVWGFCCNLIRPEDSCSAKDSLTGDRQNVSHDLARF